jgi:hypothetical protein
MMILPSIGGGIAPLFRCYVQSREVVAKATRAWLPEVGAFCPTLKIEKSGGLLMRTALRTLAATALVGAAALYAGAASGDDGWITLLDSTNKGEWNEVGKANWEFKDGAMVADKLDGKELSYLVTKNSYKDFQIRAEFWVDEEANSGVFIRCDRSDKIDAKICYEVNIFDKRPDPSYGTGPSSMWPRSIRCRRLPALECV